MIKVILIDKYYSTQTYILPILPFIL